MQILDIQIEGGRIFDPWQGREEMGTIGIVNGKIVEVQKDARAKISIDAKECYVFAGWIDWHTHLFTGGSSFGINPDKFFAQGVTRAVDMGSAGHGNITALMRELSLRDMETDVFMNVSPIGQPGYGICEPLDKEHFSHPHVGEMIQAFPQIKGLKLRYSKSIVKELGIAPLKQSIEMAQRYGLPLCVHGTDPPIKAAEIVQYLRPGDIFSHVFHEMGNTIFDEKGNIEKEVWEAKERGVLFDVGHGRVNFSFSVAKQAMKQGFYPDILSTDATAATYFQQAGYQDMAMLMSKFFALGMSLEEVVRCVTVNPAKQLKRLEEEGTLGANSRADIVICRLKEASTTFFDSQGQRQEGEWRLEPCVTISRGEIVYRRQDI